MIGESGDSFTEVTSKGLGSRLMESIKGVLVGLVMFIAAFPVLWKNEGCSVQTAKGLEEGAKAVVSIKAEKVDAINNGKLVHLSGQATTNEVLTDAAMGVSQNGIKLIRSVEMYQWKQESHSETKKKIGGGEETKTTYTYTKDWSDSRIDSSRFKQKGYNNPRMPYQDKTETAKLVMLGAFRLSPALIEQISNSEELPLQHGNLARLPADIRGRSRLADNTIYVGNDPSNPQIGDLRIKYAVVKPQMVSVISKQQNGTFEAYKTKQETEINRLEEGDHSAASMFAMMEKENIIQTWILRFAGFLMMAFGLGMIFRPISTLGDVLPILGSILGMGIGIFSFVVALFLSLVTIGIAWIAHRPVLGIILLAVGIGAFVTVWIIARQRKAKAAPAA